MFMKKISKVIAIALISITIATPTLNSASAMEKVSTNNINQTISLNNISNTDAGTIYISDQQFEEAFKEAFPDKEFPNSIQARKGVTKVVPRGSYGVDIYLSSRACELIIAGGSAAAGVLIGLLPGISMVVATAVVKEILATMSGWYIKNGIIVKVKYPMTIVSISQQ